MAQMVSSSVKLCASTVQNEMKHSVVSDFTLVLIK